MISKIEKYYEMKMPEINRIEEFMVLFYQMRPNLDPSKKDLDVSLA